MTQRLCLNNYDSVNNTRRYGRSEYKNKSSPRLEVSKHNEKLQQKNQSKYTTDFCEFNKLKGSNISFKLKSTAYVKFT
jgi:hypothetical protein